MRLRRGLGVHSRAMTEPITYEIELKGNVGSRSLRPLIDDFCVDQSVDGVTRLVGNITDPSQLHGVVVHLASMNVEIISIVPSRAATPGLN